MDMFHHCIDIFSAWLNTLPLSGSIGTLVEQLRSGLNGLNVAEFSATTATTFALIAAAEIGDKSQLVCMTLASRHRPTPILWGAVAAFALLNSLAVLFGAAIAHWLPDRVIAAAVAVLFAVFGISALWPEKIQDGDEQVRVMSGHGIFFTTFFLITVAEFGDKTQLAVVALSSASMPPAVWFGATAALAFTSALGILAGRALLQKFPLALLHKISGVIFLLLAAGAGYRGYALFTS
ncbi:MAG: TMEM165/GDT1 family protein [Gammaproteobacteria bacterium]